MDHETVVRLLLMIPPALCAVAFLMWVLYNLACECGPRSPRGPPVGASHHRDPRLAARPLAGPPAPPATRPFRAAASAQCRPGLDNNSAEGRIA